MSTSKKIRGDSILGTLPPDRQSEIAEHAQAHTLKETCEWLKADGIKVSSGALSTWLSSYSLRRRFQMADERTTIFMEQLARAKPSMPKAQLEEWGATYFQTQAIAENDGELFATYLKESRENKKLTLQAQQFTLERTKFETQFVEALRKALEDSKLTSLLEKKAGNAEIIAHLRQTYFSDIDALQQGGSVQLPK